MKKTEGKVTSEKDGVIDENHLFTYSEKERQDNVVNKANAKLVFLPEFVPFYPKIKEQYELSDIETLLFGFIRFFLSNASDRFYFTNEQLAGLFTCAEKTISRAVKNLQDKGIINVSRKIRAGGGQMRFIKPDWTKCPVRLDKMSRKTGQNVPTNNNKINDNKINIILHSKDESLQENGVNKLIRLFKPINPSYKRLYPNKTQRAALERMVKEHGFEKVENLLNGLPEVVTMPYAPKITTPLQLEKDFGKLVLFMAQEKKIKRRGGVVDARGL